MATAAAPTYFPPVGLKTMEGKGKEAKHFFIDGGVVLNSPVIAAYIASHVLYPQQNLDFFYYIHRYSCYKIFQYITS